MAAAVDDILAVRLRSQEPGLWISDAASTVSYPEDGANRCRLIEDWSYWFTHRNACITAALAHHPPRGPVWDIGGGNGVVAHAIVVAGGEAVVVEPGPAGAGHARARGLPVIQAAWSDGLVRPGCLPAAGLFDVVEHIADDVGFMRSIHGALAPGCPVYLTVPAHAALWSDEDTVAGHHRRYSPESLRSLLIATGFTPITIGGMFAALRLPIWLLRALPDRCGLGRKSGAAYQQEHRLPGGLLGSYLRRSFAQEVAGFAGGRPRLAGASLLAVAVRHG